MPNTCDIIMHKGKNKGKKCHEINRTCRHQRTVCEKCGSVFGYKHNYTAHLGHCHGRPGTELVQAKVQTHSPIIRKRPRVTAKRKPIIQPVEKEPDQEPPAPASASASASTHASLEETLLERINKLEQELHERPQHVTNNYINFVIMGDNFYDELVTIMGKQEAIHFLAKAAAKGNPIDVINKLYLEGTEPDSYPIACRSLEPPNFRYLNTQRQLVEDNGGSRIGHVVTDRIRNAMLLATNEIIQQRLTSDDTDRRYEEYDLGDMQDNMMKMCLDKRIVSDLAKVTENRFHPFFRAPEDIVSQEQQECN